YLHQHNIDYKHSNITDNDLDLLVRLFHQAKPGSGVRYLSGFLRRQGLRIQ
ncbi:hypothetical protein PAXINDRAFT_40904, partial [Paxillus involutus ATCC 200175]